MSAHLSTEQIENYRRRTLPVANLIATDKHLAACETCRARLDESGGSDMVVSSLRADLLRNDLDSGHLAYDLLEKYVDGKADRVDCEIVESHVRFCPQCARELNDLRSFASMMAKSRELKVAAIAATDQRIKRPAEKVSWFERVFGSGSGMRAAALAMAAVFLVAVTASVFVIMQSRNSGSSNQAAVANSNNDAVARKGHDQKGNGNVGLPSLPDSTDPMRGLARQPALSPDSTTITLALVAERPAAFDLPSSVRSVNLSLTGLKDGGKNYSLKLLEPGGRVVWQQDVVKIRDDIFVTIPASELDDGQYTLTASSDKGQARFPILVIKR